MIGKIPSSTLVDLFLGYDWGNFSVELFATNIFDERNELSRFVVCSICTQVQDRPGPSADVRPEGRGRSSSEPRRSALRELRLRRAALVAALR